MTLIDLVLVLVVFGVALYILSLVPMDGTVRKVIQVVVILFVVIWVLQQTGILHSGPALRLR